MALSFRYRLYPDEWHPSIHSIDLKQLAQRGIRGLIVDLDNTLVPWNEPNIPENIQAWVEETKSLGLAVCVLSNNAYGRVSDFCGRLGVAAVSGAVKPLPRGYQQALAALGTAATETAVIGDQLFTDVLGGKWAGCYTILVEPISRQEFFGTRLTRWLQDRIVAGMKKGDSIL